MKAKGTMITTEVMFDLKLTMTEREAQALFAMVRNVGGAPKGPRGVADSIEVALEKAGVSTNYVATPYGNIQFPETWGEFVKKGGKA